MTSPSVFQHIESNRLSDETVRQVRQLIEQGVFKPGDKLPSERELIRDLAVSRTSIREALRILEGLGLIEVRPGLGAYVLDRSRTDLSHTWKNLLLEHQQEFIDLLEVREALESKAAGLAAQRITEEGLERLMVPLEKMREAAILQDVEMAIEADNEFHACLASITENPFLIQLGDSITPAVVEQAAVAAMIAHVRNSIEDVRRIVEKLKQNAKTDNDENDILPPVTQQSE